MRLQIFSDLHADVAPTRSITVAPDIDAVIVAGDTCEGAENAFALLRQIVPMQAPVCMIMGNHEFYRREYSAEIGTARAVAPLYGVHFLENETVVVGGVRFVGATLWTDYALYGEVNLPLAMKAARDGLNDHRRIAWAKKPEWQRFRPQEALLLHRRSRDFLAAELAKPFACPIVVVTHHAPHPRSLHPRFSNELLSAAYVSDLSALIEAGKPALWVHGHVHCSFDYVFGATRVICNPHGYGRENPAFNQSLVVEVAS